jgi:hypothetical protein
VNSLHNSGSKSNVGGAWAARAGDLARWAWGRLVNRTDAWGAYLPLSRRTATRKSYTAPAVKDRGRVSLTEAVLARHFRGAAPEHVVGLHTTSPANTSLWGAVEVDYHGAGGNAAEANLAAVLAWHGRLADMGFRPLLADSNGAGGYHLRFLLARPAPTAGVFAFLRSLTADHARHGIPSQPETFPKQPAVAPPGRNGQYGNWLRLPGRHHTREHWSCVWDGSTWLEGARAVDFILALTGNDPALLPPAPPPARVAPSPRVPVRPGPAAGGDGANLADRIADRLARLPNLGEGQGRDDVAYRFACWLVRDLALSDDVALAWLERWDRGNRPPKGKERLAEITASAHAYGRRAEGCGLGPRAAGGWVEFTVEV